MRKLIKPEESPQEVFNACISKIVDSDLKNRLSSCEKYIIEASEEFSRKAQGAQLHTMVPSTLIKSVTSSPELIAVYTNRMVKKDSPGRPFYDKLLASVPQGRCPLCGQRVVSTLDHHLPKAQFPELSVVPVNLVPACKDCNLSKITYVPKTSEEETIHPYFDDIESEIWLSARVIEISPPALEFFINPPSTWSKVICNRVKKHFDVFHLKELYASHSAQELSNVKYRLSKLLVNGGEEQVRIHLMDVAESCLHNSLNSWQTAMYLALSKSKWFCAGGFS